MDMMVQKESDAADGLQIIAKAGDLADSVARCVGVLAASSLPIMNCVMVHCAGAVLSITGTDMEIAISSTIPATGMVTSFAATATSLHDAVKRLPSDAEVTLTPAKDSVRVKCGRFAVSVPTLPAEEYPSMGAAKPMLAEVDASELRRLLATTRRFVSSEATRAYLCGVYLHPHEGGMRAVATDGGALAYATAPGIASPPSIIIPTRTVTEILRMLPAEGAVRFGATDRLMFCETPTTQLVSKLVDGVYPDYSRIVPRENCTSFLVDRDKFVVAVERIAPFCEASKTVGSVRSGIAQLRFDGDEGLRIGTRGSDDHDYVDGTYTGDAVEIGVMTRNIQSVGEVTKDTLEISTHGDGAPITISCPGVPGTLFILMTARV